MQRRPTRCPGQGSHVTRRGIPGWRKTNTTEPWLGRPCKISGAANRKLMVPGRAASVQVVDLKRFFMVRGKAPQHGSQQRRRRPARHPQPALRCSPCSSVPLFTAPSGPGSLPARPVRQPCHAMRGGTGDHGHALHLGAGCTRQRCVSDGRRAPARLNDRAVPAPTGPRGPTEASRSPGHFAPRVLQLRLPCIEAKNRLV